MSCQILKNCSANSEYKLEISVPGDHSFNWTRGSVEKLSVLEISEQKVVTVRLSASKCVTALNVQRCRFKAEIPHMCSTP